VVDVALHASTREQFSCPMSNVYNIVQ
jgi:hypothetical protein